jgi:hypothetical protein
MSTRRRTADITGKRFGAWIVLKRARLPSHLVDRRRPYWHCRCDCGTKSVLTTYQLRGSPGAKPSSGCMKCREERALTVRRICAERSCRVEKKVNRRISRALTAQGFKWRCDDHQAERKYALAYAYRKRARGRVCRWCIRTDTETGWSAKVDECAACNRRGQPSRNGRHACCGEPITKTAGKHLCGQPHAVGGFIDEYDCAECGEPTVPGERGRGLCTPCRGRLRRRCMAAARAD